MTFKTLLVHADAGPGCDRRVRLAVRTAAMFDAAVVGLGAEALSGLFASGDAMADAVMMEAARERVAEDLPAAETHFHQLADGKAAVSWLADVGYPDAMLSLHARCADLIVTSRPTKHENAASAPRIADLVLSAGAPVLVCADRDAEFSAERVVVGWKDTRESRRALADSLPFLTRAKQVFVVSVSEDPDQDAPSAALEEVTARLARHGVNALAETAPRGHGMVVEALEDAANRHGADLIVVGAYARSRLQEWLLGGVTEDLAASSSKFVLFSH